MSVIVETYPDTPALVAAAGDRLVQAITTAIASVADNPGRQRFFRDPRANNDPEPTLWWSRSS